MARLAENQIAFEWQEIPPKIIQTDYWEPQKNNTETGTVDSSEKDRRGITGSARLTQDIYRLDQFAFQARKRKDILTKPFSLSTLFPVEFARFKQSGILRFATHMDFFDRELPGHYHRLIRRIRIAVIALIPPEHGVRAMLISSGISRVVVGNTIFQMRQIHRPPESITFVSPSHTTEVMELETEQKNEMLLPFEGMGVDTMWEFRLPRAGNRFNYNTISDVVFGIDYTSLFSHVYYNQVISQLNQTFYADHVVSLKQQYPDIWYKFHNTAENVPLQQEFDIISSTFPPNIDNIQITELMLYISGGPDELVDSMEVTLQFKQINSMATLGGSAIPINHTISTNKGKGSALNSLRGMSPQGRWILTFEDTPLVRNLFNDGSLDDILFVISYRGDTPPWPAM